MAALLALWFLFGSHSSPPARCPSLRHETTPIYGPAQCRIGTQVVPMQNGRCAFQNKTNATTTILKYGEYITIFQDVIGYATDTEAIAYNQRVRECQTKNGEF